MKIFILLLLVVYIALTTAKNPLYTGGSSGSNPLYKGDRGMRAFVPNMNEYENVVKQRDIRKILSELDSDDNQRPRAEKVDHTINFGKLRSLYKTAKEEYFKLGDIKQKLEIYLEEYN
eukprot:TRINITY_DN927_c0_g2_i1.p1 TRINITY_DN927_c0_g2~~TRINITY_DN927_c0_g2_i1.p1  ORF type:complete len:118 (+),score=19.59 TRINITY_DN927_c0_g2_i1:127-480(+)